MITWSFSLFFETNTDRNSKNLGQESVQFVEVFHSMKPLLRNRFNFDLAARGGKHDCSAIHLENIATFAC